MISKKLFAAAGATMLVSSAAFAGTLDDVKSAGTVRCGVTDGGIPGFAAPDDSGNWKGIDADVCKAVSAAVFGSTDKVTYVPVSSKERFTALASGEVDMLSRNTTWTFSRDNNLGINFVGVNYYDGQGFMVRKDLGVASAKDLDGASVCIQTGTTTELNLADYFRTNNMKYESVVVESNAEARKAYEANRCDVYTTDASGLAADRSVLADPGAHVILPEIVSKEPLGPSVAHGDDQWHDIVRWSLNAMIAAEEMGVTSANVDDMKANSTNPEVGRLLGKDGGLGEMLGLSADFAYNIIKNVGNYGESFESNVGPNTPIGLSRGLNAQWTDGGLMYSPPFR